MFRLSSSLLFSLLCISPAVAQHGTAFRTDRGTLLDPAADGTPRYREDTGWSTSRFSDPHWAVEYGTTLGSTPWTVVQQGDRTNAAFTAAANKLTLDLAGSTFTVLPFLGDNGVEGGPVSIVDRFGTGAFLRIANGTFLNTVSSSARLTVGESNLTGRLFIENALLETRNADIGYLGRSTGFATIEAGGELKVVNNLVLGSPGTGLLELRGSDARVAAESIYIGRVGGNGAAILTGENSLLHSRRDLTIDNPIPGHPDDNIGLVINAGTAQVDGNLLLLNHYAAVSVDGGRLAVAGLVDMITSSSDTAGGKIYLHDGRIELADSFAVRPAPLKCFFWEDGTLAFTDADVSLSDVQLGDFTRQGAISYGGDRAAGTLAAGQVIESAGRLTVTGNEIGLAGGTIRAGTELVLNAPLTGHGTLDAVVAGNGAITNTTTNRLTIGALAGANSISSAGELHVGTRGVDATFAGTSTGTGRFIKVGTATQSVTGQIANSGGIDVRQGKLLFDGPGSKLDTSTIALADAAALSFSAGATGAASTATIGTSPSGGPPARLEINGAGSALTIGGDLSNNGWIGITGGTLGVGGTLVNEGMLINNGQLDATIAGSGVVSGGGRFDGAVTIAAGGMLSPGNSPGTAHFLDLTLGPGGTFELELAAATGTAGSDWDLAIVSELLSITATAADPLSIVLKSLDASLLEGPLAGFDPTQSYSWQFLSAAIADPQAIDLAAFRIDSSAFESSNDPGTGVFQIAAAADGLYVNFAAQPASVPEPGSALLLFAAGLATAGLRRKRRRS